MAVRGYIYKSWVGGQSVDKKVGQANAFASSEAADFRKSPSQLSVLPGTRRTDGNIVTDLVQNEVMTESGKIYAIGSSGNVYIIDTSGVWSLFGSTGQSGTFGIEYRQDQNAVYIAGTTKVTSITNVSTTPTLNAGYYAASQSTYDNTSNTGFNVNSDQTNGTEEIPIQTSFTESSSSGKRFFQTDIQPITKIGVDIIEKGTGNWTMTLHDGLGNLLATKTILNANLLSSQRNYFEFTPVQVNVGPNNAQTYHFHITSTVADGSIAGTNPGDMSSCNMGLFADRLVETVNGLHPMTTFQQYTCIGNGRYLSVWENLGEAEPSNSAWQRQKLVFPPGYEVCGLAVFNEYLAIAVERVTTGDETPQEGIIFYWDGLSSTYNYFTRIPEGSPEAIYEYENAVYYVAAGSKYVITSVASTPQKVRRLPGSENVYTASNVQTQVYPYTAAVRYGIHLFAWPSTTTNTDIPFGVYSWGQVDYTQPVSFGYSYVLSTGTKYKTDTNNLTIGMVKNFGNVLHISWRDGDEYGVDVVDADSTPAPFMTVENLIEDADIPTKQHQGLYMEAHWLTIQDGVEIVLKYSINRGEWVESERFSNNNLWSPLNIPGYAKFAIDSSARFYEIQTAVDVYCDETVTEPPVIVGVSGMIDTLNQELIQ